MPASETMRVSYRNGYQSGEVTNVVSKQLAGIIFRQLSCTPK